jgi:hypothetical protein
MWCGTCQSDVVTEVASDHRRVSCSICGATLGETAASKDANEDSSPRSAKTSQARELLDRWAKSPLFDPYGPARTGQESAAESTRAESPNSQDETPQTAASPHTRQPLPSQATLQVEATRTPTSAVPQSSHPTDQPVTGNAEELDRLTEEILSRVARITDSIRQPATAAAEVAQRESPTTPAAETPSDRVVESPEEAAWRVDSSHAARPHEASRPGGRSFDAAGNPVSAITGRANMEEPAPHRIDPTHAQASIPAPHAEFTQPTQASPSNPPQKSGFVGGIGQVLAYFGILGLTAGTSLVIVGYFGGPAHYAPTGWLITTIGQMMLFLGVVTLVSTGMEQTQAEVRESLDETLREVSSRIDQLGQRLTRIDASAHETPPAPHSLTRTPADIGSESVRRD